MTEHDEMIAVCRVCGAHYAVDFEPSLHCHPDEEWEMRFVRDWRSYWTVERVEHIPYDEPAPPVSSLGHVADESMLVDGGVIEPMSHTCGRQMTVGSLTLSAERMRLWFHCAVCNETVPIMDTINNPLVD